jgi:hypothetical protein
MTIAGRFGKGAGRVLAARGKRERVPPRRFSAGAKIAAVTARGSLPPISPALPEELAVACSLRTVRGNSGNSEPKQRRPCW